MTTPPHLWEAAEHTWPPLRSFDLGPWRLRDGAGGGKRVSAATPRAPDAAGAADAIAQAETAMTAAGQTPLFLLRPDQTALDTRLAGAGYRVIDPVVALAAPIAQIAAPHGPLGAFDIWPPLAIMNSIWDQGGIDASRRAVMARVAGPHTGIMGRADNHPAGCCFVALYHDIAFCHALHVLDQRRRQGTAVNMLRRAATWAQDRGATTFAALVTRDNAGARALYASLNMQDVGGYHYRIKDAEER